MKLKLITFKRRDGRVPVEEDLSAIAKVSKAAAKDVVRLKAALEVWAEVGFAGGGQLDFRRIQGPPFYGKLWEARYLKSGRSDGVHGYRVFYWCARHPTTDQEIVVLLKVWAKEGRDTPKAVYHEAWEYAQEVQELLEAGRFFAPPAGKGLH